MATARERRRAESRRRMRRQRSLLVAAAVLLLTVVVAVALATSGGSHGRSRRDGSASASEGRGHPVVAGGPLAPAALGGLAALWAPQNVVGPQPGTAAAYEAASRLPAPAGYLLIADRGNNRILVVDPQGKVVFLYPSAADLAAGRRL